MAGPPGAPKQNSSLNPTSNSQVMAPQVRPSVRASQAGRPQDGNNSRPLSAGMAHTPGRHHPAPGLFLQSTGGRGRGGQVGAPNTPMAVLANLWAAHNAGRGHTQRAGVPGVGTKPNLPPELLKSFSVAAHNHAAAHSSKQMSRPQTAPPNEGYRRALAMAVSEGGEGGAIAQPIVVQSKGGGQAPVSRSGPKVDQTSMPTQVASRARQLGLQSGLQGGRTFQLQGVSSGQGGNIVVAHSTPSSHSGQRQGGPLHQGFPLPKDASQQSFASAANLVRTLGPLMQQSERPNQRGHDAQVGPTTSTTLATPPQHQAIATSTSRDPTSMGPNRAPMMVKGTGGNANLPGNLTLVPSFLVQMPGGQFRLVNSSPFLGLRGQGQEGTNDGVSNSSTGGKGKQSAAMPAIVLPMSQPEAKGSNAINSPVALQLSMSRPLPRAVPMERPQRLPNIITTIPQEAKPPVPFQLSAASLGMIKPEGGPPKSRLPQSYRVKEPALVWRRTQKAEERNGAAAVVEPVVLSGKDGSQWMLHGHNEGNVSDREDKDMMSVAESLKDLSSMDMRQASDSPPHLAVGTTEQVDGPNKASASFSNKDKTGEASDPSGTGTDAFSNLDILIDAATKTEGQFFSSFSKPSSSRGISKRRRGTHGSMHLFRGSTSAVDSISDAFSLHWRQQSHPRYIGISRVLRSGKYVARCRHKGEAIEIGQFDSAELAAKAYDRTILGLRGEHARTNFPKEDYMKFEVDNTARAFKTKERQRSREGGRRRRDSWSPWARAAQTLLGPESPDVSLSAPSPYKRADAMPETRRTRVRQVMTLLNQLRAKDPGVFDEALAKVQSAACSADSIPVPADVPNGQALPLLEDIDQPTQNIEETLKAVLTRVDELHKLVASGDGSLEDKMSLQQHTYAAEVLQNILNAKTSRQGKGTQASTSGLLSRPGHMKSDPEAHSGGSDKGVGPKWMSQLGSSHVGWGKAGGNQFGFYCDGGDAGGSDRLRLLPRTSTDPGAPVSNGVGHLGTSLVPFQPTRLAGRKNFNPSEASGRAAGALGLPHGLQKLGDLSGNSLAAHSVCSLDQPSASGRVSMRSVRPDWDVLPHPGGGFSPDGGRLAGTGNVRHPLSPKSSPRRPPVGARRSARNCPKRDTDIWVMPSLRGRGAWRSMSSGLVRSFVDLDAEDDDEMDSRRRRGVYRYGRRTGTRRRVTAGRVRGRGYRGRGRGGYRGRSSRRGAGRARGRRGDVRSREASPGEAGGDGELMAGESRNFGGGHESDAAIEEVAEALTALRGDVDGRQGPEDDGPEAWPSSRHMGEGRGVVPDDGAAGFVRVEAAQQVCVAVEEAAMSGGEMGDMGEEWEESESLTPLAASQGAGLIGNEELKHYRESLGWGKMLACSLWPKKRGGGMLAKAFDGNYRGHGHRVRLLDVRKELFRDVDGSSGEQLLGQQTDPR